MTEWPVARQQARRDMANNLTDHQFLFGTLVEYIQITAMDKARVKQFGKKTLKGICFGYVLRVGGGWSGDFYGGRL